MLLNDSKLIAILLVSGVTLSLLFSVLSLGLDFAKVAGKSHKNPNVTKLNKLGNKIKGLEPPSGIVKFGNVITCAALTICLGTNRDDIIYGGVKEQVFAFDGNDIVYSGLDDQVYGGKNADLLIAGGGRVLLDGGSGSDTLIGGVGNDLLIGGPGDDKLFAGIGTSVMFGGPGANHFDCPLLGLEKSVVMDYNPTNGDTIAGVCKIVNTLESNTGTNNVPQINLPDTGESGTSSGIRVPGS